MTIAKNKLLYKLLLLILVVSIFIRPAITVYNQREVFFSKGYSTQYKYLQKLYYSSQYVKKDNHGFIPDQALEAFAAGAFLKGINPILIVHDQPPLGRYILALSIFAFDNVSTVLIFLLIFSAIGVFLIAKSILKSSLVSLIPVGIFVNEPLFLSKLTVGPLLEPVQLPFIIFSLYFFIRGVAGKTYTKWFILTSCMLGTVISIRFFALGIFLLLSMLIYFLLNRQFNKKIIIFLCTLPIALVVLLLSYVKTIQDGSSLLHIFGIQKYIYFYHKSQLTLPFSFWDLLMFNRWHTWWGTRSISSDFQWVIIWPIGMLASIVFLIFSLVKKILISDQEKIILIWIFTYSFFLSLGQTSTRYFLPLLPFLYIISASLILKILVRIKK